MPQAVLPRRTDLTAREETPEVSEMRLHESGASLQSVLRQDCQEELVFERLRDAINAALEAAASSDAGVALGKMREAVIQARASLEAMRQGAQQTEQRLGHERQQLADAERRGRLARGIDDAETAEVAERFAAKHRERVEVLERKLDAQQSELQLAEREYGEMKSQLLAAERSRPQTDAARSVEAAWRDLEAAGASRPETDVEGEHLRAQMDRSAREARAEEQLQELKRKMGKG